MPAAGEVVLEGLGARRLFAGGRGLDGAELRLRRGEIYGLLGPNGAGKTSLDGVDFLRVADVPAEGGRPPKFEDVASTLRKHVPAGGH